MRRLSFILILLSTPIVAYASEYNYLGANDIKPEILVPPAQNGSTELKEEAEQIMKIQKSAGKVVIAQAESESEYRPELVIYDLIDHPATTAFINKANNDCDKIVRQAKDYWHITRPYLADPKIKLLINAPGGKSYSYPSGHTTCSLLTAEIAGQVRPAMFGSYQSDAKEIAKNRVLGGVHWPQDIEAGHDLALIIFGVMQTSDAYKADFAKAKKEWQ